MAAGVSEAIAEPAAVLILGIYNSLPIDGKATGFRRVNSPGTAKLRPHQGWYPKCPGQCYTSQEG